MEIRFGKYRVHTDSYQYILSEFKGVTLDNDGEEQERYVVWGYYPTLETLVAALPDHVLRRSNGNLSEAVVEVREVTNALKNALTRAKEDA